MDKKASEHVMSVVERQMRRWELGFEVHERIEKEQAAREIPRQVHPYISISRQAGARASEVARIISEKLGLELLDQELLDCMADRYSLSKGMLESVDEEHCIWLSEVFGQWLSQRMVTQSEYVAHLGRIVLLTARTGGTIFVGRGVHFMLPLEKGLRVWIIAPLEKRIARVMKLRKWSRENARKYVEDKDRGRRNFIRRYFRRDLTDPHLYDVVINTERMPSEEAADLIAGEYRTRFGAGEE